MSIRRIKAHKAHHVNDDYISVETQSYKTFGAIIGVIVGLFVGAALGDGSSTQSWFIFTGSILGFVLGLLLAPGKVVREIPSVDLVEIKRYDYKNRVTVVLDDERTKKRQAVSSTEG